MEKILYLKSFKKYVNIKCSRNDRVICYILADTYFVSKGWGADGLTALNLAILYILLLMELD